MERSYKGIDLSKPPEPSFKYATLGKPKATIEVLSFDRQIYAKHVSPISQKPIERYLFNIVDDKGEKKILSVGKSLARKFIEKLVEPPKKSKWRQLCERWWVVKLFERMGWLAKMPEPEYICEISHEMDGQFPRYDVKWSEDVPA